MTQQEKHLLITLPILIMVITVLRHGMAIDHAISNQFFIDGQWLWPKQDSHLTFLLHEVPKYIFIGIGGACLLICIAGTLIKSIKTYCYPALMIALSLLVIPIIIGQLKAQTHIFCPSSLQLYHGIIPDHYRQMTLSSEMLSHSRCFPAAHPSPGFALFILGVLATTPWKKVLGYSIGVFAGLSLSVIQIGRGEHFLTHCFATALIALWIVHALPMIAELLPTLFKKAKNAHHIL